MKEVLLEQGSDAWLLFRQNKIGSSDSPVILGMSPYKTRAELYQEKMGLSQGQEKTYAMQRGNDLEPMIREKMSALLGCQLLSKVFISEEREWQSASVDGIDVDMGIVVEIKCANSVDHSKAQKGIVPEKYLPQLYHILSVLGMNEIWYCSYHKGDLIHFIVERNQSSIDAMIRQEEEFWNSLQTFTKPEITEEHKEHTKEPKIYEERNDEEWQQLALQLTLVRSQKKALLEEEEMLEDALITLSGGVNTSGNGLTLTLQTRRGQLDYSSITELQGIDLEKYRKPSTQFWVIK